MIVLLAAVACVAVLALGLQASFFAANPDATVLACALALLLIMALGILAHRRLSAPAAHGPFSESLSLDAEPPLFAHSTSLVQAGDEILRDCAELSSGAGEQGRALAAASSSMAQLGAALRDTATHARRAAEVAGEAETRASKGAEVMTTTIAAMDEIADSARRIGEIVAVIDGIAFQTNLLALNAAVEAARAGALGRGFAVVASEVRDLAQRAGEAAKEIRGLVRVSTEAIGQGEERVASTGEAFSEIRGAILRLNEIVAQIASSSEGQRADIDEIGRAVDVMDRASRMNTALVRRAAGAAEILVTEVRALGAGAGQSGA